MALIMLFVSLISNLRNINLVQLICKPCNNRSMNAIILARLAIVKELCMEMIFIESAVWGNYVKMILW